MFKQIVRLGLVPLLAVTFQAQACGFGGEGAEGERGRIEQPLRGEGGEREGGEREGGFAGEGEEAED